MVSFLNGLRCGLCALLLVGSVAPRAQVAEVGAGIAASAAVDSVINGVRSALDEAISQAEAAGTTVSFRVASDARMLMQNLDIMANDFRGKVFSDLNQAQQSALNNLLVVSRETTRDLKANIGALDAAVRTAGAEISRIPGVSKRPLVSSYAPGFILTNAEGPLTVSFAGSLLNTESVTLKLGANDCQQIASTENTLRFSCQTGPLAAESGKWLHGDLSLTPRKPWYEFWRERKTYTYKVAVGLVQAEMGTYVVDATTQVNGEERIRRSESNGYRNDHCRGGHTVVWTFTPVRAGCNIDVTSVNASANTTSNSTWEGVINKGPGGFQVRGTVRNSGSCGPFYRDARGSINASASWVDVCPTTTEAAIVPVTGSLKWTAQEAIQLPPNTIRFIVKVKLRDGSQQVVSGAGSYPWFVVEFNQATKLLVIRPRPIDEALV